MYSRYCLHQLNNKGNKSGAEQIFHFAYILTGFKDSITQRLFLSMLLTVIPIT